MKFLVDAHFPRRLSYWLIENGEDSIHTLDLPNKNKTTDIDLINKADSDSESRVIITKDSDFIRYRILKGKPDRILMVTTGNIINKELVKLFEANFPDIKRLFENGNKVIEVDNASITIHE